MHYATACAGDVINVASTSNRRPSYCLAKCGLKPWLDRLEPVETGRAVTQITDDC